MAATRTQKEIEQDVANINHALLTVSELRSSLRQFVRTVESNPKNPSYISQFGEGLQKIRRDLSRQALEGEHLKGALEYAQQVAQENDFDLAAINEFMANETSVEQHVDTDTRTKQETGNLMKGQVDYLFSELSSVVLQKYHTHLSEDDIPTDFITKNFDRWMTSDKDQHRHIVGKFLQPEQRITTGSVCCLEVSVEKVLTATLDLEYHHATNSLIIHRYEIKGPKEDKPFWQESKYNVFQKINMIAAKAFEEMTVLSAREALLNSLNWLSSYHHLFSEPCHRCRKRLQFDSPRYKHLPPVIRTWSHQNNNNNNNNTTSNSSSPPPPPLLSKNNESPASDRAALGSPYHLRCFTGLNG